DIGRGVLGLSIECFSCHNGAGHTDSFNMFLGSRKRSDFWQQAAFFGKLRNIGSSDGSGRNFYGEQAQYDDLAPGYNTGDDWPYYTPAEGRFPRDGKAYEPAFIKTIMKSKASQLSTSFRGEWKLAYIPYFARRFVRVLTPPEAVDMVAQATDQPFEIKEVRGGAGNRAEKLDVPFNYVSQLFDPLAVRGLERPGSENLQIYAFLGAYYQAERTTPPVDKNIATPVQAMMMMTSPLVQKRVKAEGTTRVAKLLQAGKSDDQV